MSTQSLQASTPAAEGVDVRGIEAFLDAIEAAPDIEPHSVMILRRGHLIAAGWWAPYGPDRMHLLYSLSKSFTGTAAGLAVTEGLLNLDAPVVSYFPEFAADITDPGSRSILVRHVASMASGHLTGHRAHPPGRKLRRSAIADRGHGHRCGRWRRLRHPASRRRLAARPALRPETLDGQ